MIEFKDCDVFVNGTGIIAESAAISSDASLQAIYAVGFSNVSRVPNGQVRNSFEISYIVKLASEPCFAIVKALRNGDAHAAVVEIAGLSGFAYLDRFSLRAAPNDVVKVSVGFTSFQPLSGSVVQKRGVAYNTNHEDLSHGYTTYITSSGTYLNVPTYEFGYEFNGNWNPFYKIGLKEPVQVSFVGGEEKIDLVRDEFYQAEFSGESVKKRLFTANSENEIQLKQLSYSWNQEVTEGISMNFSGAKINSSRFDLNPSDFAKTRITIVRGF